jgi:tetratricopeptide (TPR) repeat protein
MADAAIGFERSIDNMKGYSPILGGDRGTVARPGIAAGDANDLDFNSLIRLGTQKLDLGNEADAEAYFRKALEAGDRSLGPDHPDLVLVVNDLTRLYLKRGAHSAAEPLLLRLLDMKRSKGDDHPEVGTVLASLAAVRQALGRHESAEQLWRRVVEIRDRTLAPNHFAIATALEHLGDSCAARGNIREALSVFQRAQTIRERTLGSDHASLRTSRERIADLLLQASEDSLELGPGAAMGPTPEKYRLLSGEPLAAAPPPPAQVQKPSGPPARKAALVMPRQFSEETEAREDDLAEEGVAATPPLMLQSNAAPYRDALDSIREELERPAEPGTFALRSAAILETVTTFLGRREVIAVTVVTVISLLLVAVATNSRAAGGEQTSTAGTQTTSQLTQVAAAVSSAPALTVSDRSAIIAPPATAPARETASRPRVAEEHATPKKAIDKKPEPKSIAIPSVSSAMMSRLDSLASKAATTSGQAAVPLTVQAAPTNFGGQRSSFDYTDQPSAPQRARLIGDMPIPRIPDQVADVEGEVRVRFNVDAEGMPVMSTFAVIASPNPLLTTAVRKVIPGMRFEPARASGSDSKPTGDVVQIGFQFARPRR